jgi:pimeloyl-ACP methyl ester carboxylesterase
MIETRYEAVGATRMHYAIAGSGPVIALIHGWPQTWRAWRKLMPLLADNYTLIAPDMTGLGLSDLGSGDYAKSSVANDIWTLLADRLGIGEFFLVGHDWGGPVAFSLALDHPKQVKRLAILDVAIPGDGAPNISQGGKRWHHAFHQTPDLPEQLTAGRERIYLDWFYKNYGHRPDAVDDAEIDEYARLYSRPGRMAAGFGYYRAIPMDIADNRARLAHGKLDVPTLALGGDSGWGRGEEVAESVRRVATNVTGGVISKCGHWMPEEQPEELARRLREFFR